MDETEFDSNVEGMRVISRQKHVSVMEEKNIICAVLSSSGP